jgi:hypothetical protein
VGTQTRGGGGKKSDAGGRLGQSGHTVEHSNGKWRVVLLDRGYQQRKHVLEHGRDTLQYRYLWQQKKPQLSEQEA